MNDTGHRSKPIPAGTNPRRFFRRHRERGPNKAAFTAQDVADAAGVSVATARRARAAASLESAVEFVIKHRGGPALTFSIEDVAAARGVSVHAVRAHIQRGHLNMRDLTSIARYVLHIREVPSIRDHETPRIKETA